MSACLRCVLVWLALAGCTGSGGGLVIQTVSEYEGSPIAGVKVQVGDQPWTTTDAGGRARFAAVTSPYTVRIHQPMTFTDSKGVPHQHDKVWHLVGRDQNPLVVQVDGSLAQIYKANISGTIAGRSASPGSEVVVVAGTSFPFPVAGDGTFDLPSVSWEGGTARDLDLRALETSGQPPLHYTRYGATRVHVVDTTGFLGAGGNLGGVTVQLNPVSEARVSGQVALPDELAQSNLSAAIWLRYNEYESISVSPGAPSGQPASFDYALPVIDGAAPWIQFAATSPTGNSYGNAYAWQARKVSLPSSGVAFDLPTPPTLTEPADGSGIGPATVFRWSAVAPGGTYTLDVSCDEWTAGILRKGVHYRGIETTGTEASLPVIPDVAVPAGTPCSWSVGWNAATDPATEIRYSWSEGRAATAL